MKTKSLGELLSDSEDVVYGCSTPCWRKLTPFMKKVYQRTACIFLNACGKDPGATQVAVARILCGVVRAKAETTSPATASKAAKALRSKRTGKVGKSIAASALTQARGRRAGK